MNLKALLGRLRKVLLLPSRIITYKHWGVNSDVVNALVVSGKSFISIGKM